MTHPSRRPHGSTLNSWTYWIELSRTSTLNFDIVEMYKDAFQEVKSDFIEISDRPNRESIYMFLALEASQMPMDTNI
eukprot:Gb_15879 [translate_table: standard]